MQDDQPTAPDEHCRDAGVHPETRIRTFSLNSKEAYDALATPRERPWIPNGALPREPRVWEREVVACSERSRTRS
jgi:hypothetical protein